MKLGCDSNVFNQKLEGEVLPKLRKTHPAAPGSLFAKARVEVDFATIHNCIFLLITTSYYFYRVSMGC